MEGDVWNSGKMELNKCDEDEITQMAVTESGHAVSPTRRTDDVREIL